MQVCLDSLQAVYPGDVKMDALMRLCNYNNGSLCSTINKCLCSLKLSENPLFSMITSSKYHGCSFKELIADIEKGLEHTAFLLEAILLAEVGSTFHKINIHAALTPVDIITLLEPAIKQAQLLQETFSGTSTVPFITVSKK